MVNLSLYQSLKTHSLNFSNILAFPIHELIPIVHALMDKLNVSLLLSHLFYKMLFTPIPLSSLTGLIVYPQLPTLFACPLLFSTNHPFKLFMVFSPTSSHLLITHTLMSSSSSPHKPKLIAISLSFKKYKTRLFK